MLLHHDGIRSVLQKLCTDVPVSGCVCHIDTEDLHIVNIAGICSNICALCYRMLQDIIISYLSERPHSPITMNLDMLLYHFVLVLLWHNLMRTCGMIVCLEGILLNISNA